MSREIKFRIWNDIDKCFIYSTPFNSDAVFGGGYNKEGVYYFFHGNANISGELCQVKSFGFSNDTIVQPFTGKKDKNDKEIYEGDIIRYINGSDDWLMSVHWDNWGSRWCGKHFTSGNEIPLISFYEGMLEVIDNLLESKGYAPIPKLFKI